MSDTSKEISDLQAFAASAAALVASHAMADTVWDTYFPDLPRKQPELRTILVELHRRALLDNPPNLGDARDMIKSRFDVESGTAAKWTDLLEKLGFLVRMEDAKKSAFRLVPSAEAKIGLFKVGQDYLVCLGQVVRQLRNAMRHTPVDPEDLDWLGDVRLALETVVVDYKTKSAKEA
ncbi:hypothetical protein [Mesorhizobium temperatum]|uniref:Uncharacterized protein n=1 Tax=Mesorhizobium temperatum TaxID=241416 RepID=A0A271LLQ9_9HYPH|nr:hypothetical protein [Mesorhizobium temperatum]PAQ09049.1 hypothetical protein CIT26_14150 [Mesorhizobium temperatum]